VLSNSFLFDGFLESTSFLMDFLKTLLSFRLLYLIRRGDTVLIALSNHSFPGGLQEISFIVVDYWKTVNKKSF